MKHAIVGAIALACLSGCAQTSAVAPSPTSVATASGTLAGAAVSALPAATAAKIQAAAAKSCAFQPTLATIANIFAAGSTTTTINGIAAAICQAIAAAPAGNGLGLLDARAGSGPPAVGNVIVHGKFSDGRKI